MIGKIGEIGEIGEIEEIVKLKKLQLCDLLYKHIYFAVKNVLDLITSR